MNIKIEKKNFENLNIETLRDRCGQALDALWESSWVRFAITKTDRKNLEVLQAVADKVIAAGDIALILADGEISQVIKAAVSAAPQSENAAEIIVFGNTLSPSDYAETLHRLKGKDFSLITICEAEESLPLRGAYACMKQLLISRYGTEQAAEHIFAIAGKQSRMLTEDASENDYPLLSYPEIPAIFGAGTDAVLLPLALKGVDLSAYLDGFYEMLASPAWDLDAADYAMGRAVCENRNMHEQLIYWQSQLDGIAAWQGDNCRMPGGNIRSGKFETFLLIEKDEEDIMMPFFEGCNEDGSLNQLLLEQAEAYFADEAPGVKLSIEVLDAYTLGQLFAFVQLSEGITAFLTAETH